MRPGAAARPRPLVTDPRHWPEMAAWAAARIPRVGAAGFGPCAAVGVVVARRLGAVVVYHGWDPEAGTVQASVASDTPLWATREAVGGALGVAFEGRLGARCHKVWALCEPDGRASRFLGKAGFRREAVLRHQFGPRRNAEFWSMTGGAWRRLYGSA